MGIRWGQNALSDLLAGLGDENHNPSPSPSTDGAYVAMVALTIRQRAITLVKSSRL